MDKYINQKKAADLLRAYAETIDDSYIRKKNAPQVRIGIKMAADFIEDLNESSDMNENANGLRKCKGSAMVQKDGKWQTEEFSLGYFHQWGVNYEEIGEGPGNYSVAIVELLDGRIVMPTADNITFLNQ